MGLQKPDKKKGQTGEIELKESRKLKLMKRKTLNILSVLFGLLLINGGLNKFLDYMSAP